MLLQRRRARERLTEYAKFIDIPGVPLPEEYEPEDGWNDPEYIERVGDLVEDLNDHSFNVVETELAIHHTIVLDTCQDLVERNLRYYFDDDGEIQPCTPEYRGKYHVCMRVMLMLPPGSAKSTYASVVFPTWQMGNNPNHEIILTGYGDTICKRHGKL